MKLLKKYLVSQSLKLTKHEKKYSLNDIIFSMTFKFVDYSTKSLYCNWPEYKKYQTKINQYKNKYKGKRCFIIGNGPSLRNTNLALLKDEYTFGLNRIYLLFEKIGFTTSFYVSVNKLVINQFKPDIDKLKMPKFVTFKQGKYLKKDEHLVLINQLVYPQFSKNLSQGIWEGATVTFVAMQIAYWLGFNEVYLIGVDHNFKYNGKAHELVTSQENDKNHFDLNYFGKGIKWNLPDLDTSTLAYQMAKKAFEESGRKIYDATIGGKLKVFPKIDYNSLFERTI